MMLILAEEAYHADDVALGFSPLRHVARGGVSQIARPKATRRQMARELHFSCAAAVALSFR